MKQATILLFLLLGAFSCETTEPPPPTTTQIQLRAIDASCTEVWLEVRFTEGASPRTITIKRDSLTVLNTMLVASETLVVDDGILPNRQYIYTLSRPNGPLIDRVSATVTTMDTTSHNWSFVAETLGVTSSALYDAAIVSENNIWAVGELYLNDSSGQLDPLRYNAAHWDGNTWTILRGPYYYQGQPVHNPIQTIFALGPNDIWFAGNGVIHWNGQEYTPIEIPPSVWGPHRINKIWGSSTNLYIVGNNGSIAHYASGTWRRVESGTTVNINDVWGYHGTSSGLTLGAASNRYTGGERKLLELQAASVETLSWLPQQRLHTIWHHSRHQIFVGGGGLYVGTPGDWQEVQGLPSYFSTRIRGTSHNNVWVVGAFGLCGHFNGFTWRSYPEVGLPDGTLEGLAVMEQSIMAVGQVGNRAIVVRGSAL